LPSTLRFLPKGIAEQIASTKAARTPGKTPDIYPGFAEEDPLKGDAVP
jgi:hypothetical protein